MVDTLLFDLDGTLLPNWQDEYLAAYFKSIAVQLGKLGFEPKAAAQALFESSYAMIRNDGTKLNRDVFFEDYQNKLGPRVLSIEPALETYYRTDFSVVAETLKQKRDCRPMLSALREKGYALVLATNPLFPLCALETRLSWVGLCADDFDHITHYENAHFCKPNPAYYREIFAAIGRDASRCLMIGNSIAEDMPAGKLGAAVYLVRDYLENPEQADPAAYPGGSWQQMCAMLDALPALHG